ncbi:reticulon-1 isoform X2 [Aphidius gifuensis]|uniref:reticulon-1 isoform X2 n=1 Tax=Aphidius gifuensis TaxID=684658 RepID=UPI001CDD711A|nr:reticulon-1 isoform X2 [Aphidius gifuensis]
MDNRDIMDVDKITAKNMEIKLDTGNIDPMTLVEAATEKLERNLLDASILDSSPNDILKPIQATTTTPSFVSSGDLISNDFIAPTKPLPPVPSNDNNLFTSNHNDYNKEHHNNDIDNDNIDDDDDNNNDDDIIEKHDNDIQANDSADEEFESEIESSPVKVAPVCQMPKINQQPQLFTKKIESANLIDEEIAPSKIFSNMKLDAWFNPERLNPRVAGLIYWRRPEETGIVFGGILGILLSLAYFSLISVFSYTALLSLTLTFGYRIYKTVMQAVQKTSDGHPFKDILDIDLTVSADKVHQVADVAVVHVNAAVSELRRLFLIEDFIDSLKFGVVLWCLTYVGSWFNGMTLIIIGVVALFTLPKVYETNKVQIDQNLALVQAKINELTAKVKAAIPLGKKVEAAKEE